MRTLLFVIGTILPLLSFSQLSYEKYLDASLGPVFEREEASFFQVITPEGMNKYKVETFFMDGKLKFYGYYMDAEASVEHGWFEYYFDNGEKESTGKYEHGFKTGSWKRWTRDGTAKAERFYHNAKKETIHYVPAEYSGGEAVMTNDLASAVISLRKEVNILEEGTINVAFTINKEGEVLDVQVVNPGNIKQDHVAIKAVRSLTAWQPAMNNGKAIESLFILPVVFVPAIQG